MAPPDCEITSLNSTDVDQKMIDYETVDQKMTPPLLESDTSSLNTDASLASPSSTQFFTPREYSPKDRGNTLPTTTDVNMADATVTHTHQTTVLDDAVRRLFGPSEAQQAQLDIEQQQAQYKALGSIQKVKLGYEFDYRVSRKRERRVEKMYGHKNSMSPELQQRLAESAQKRVHREKMEKKKAQKEKRKVWELELELFGDGGKIFGDDDKLE